MSDTLTHKTGQNNSSKGIILPKTSSKPQLQGQKYSDNCLTKFITSVLLRAFNWLTMIWDFSPKSVSSPSWISDFFSEHAVGFLLPLLLDWHDEERVSEYHSNERLLEPFPYTWLVFLSVPLRAFLFLCKLSASPQPLLDLSRHSEPLLLLVALIYEALIGIDLIYHRNCFFLSEPSTADVIKHLYNRLSMLPLPEDVVYRTICELWLTFGA